MISNCQRNSDSLKTLRFPCKQKWNPAFPASFYKLCLSFECVAKKQITCDRLLMRMVCDKSRQRQPMSMRRRSLVDARGEAFHYHEGNNILLSKSFSLLSPRVAPHDVCVWRCIRNADKSLLSMGRRATKYQPEMNGCCLKKSIYRAVDGRTRTHTHTHLDCTMGIQLQAKQVDASDFCQKKGKRRWKSPEQFTSAHFFILHNEAANPTHTAVAGCKGEEKREKEGALS